MAASISGLAIGLSVAFACLFLAIVAELYYLLWWKKRIVNTQIINEEEADAVPKDNSHLFRRNERPTSPNYESSQEIARIDTEDRNLRDPDDLEQGVSGEDSLLTPFAEESAESELMRLHNLVGPPRFLFTIKEESKEDLQSEDGKSRGDRSRKGSRTRSLSDFSDSPFLSPLASPAMKYPALSPLESYSHQGFNPPFESSSEVEQLCRLRSSPPPKFKFLRDAEEKLYRRLIQEAEKRASRNCDSVQEIDLESPTSTSIVEDKEKESYNHFPQYPSGSSQVLPLASSPTAFGSAEKKPKAH